MRGQTLTQLLSELKAECGYSQNQAHGINNRESLVQTLKRTQRRLWSEWDWMHLRVSRDMQLFAGQRYYNCPADLPYERIDSAEVKFGGQWMPLTFEITERQYSVFDPRTNGRSWPIQRWDVAEDMADTAGTPDNRGMIEVWPLPSDTGESGGSLEGNLRLNGIRFLRRFEQDADRCDLDGDMIVLYAASEVLGRDRKDDAQSKLLQGQQLFQKLRGNQDKRRSFTLGGEDSGDERQPEVFAHPVPFSMGHNSAPYVPAPMGEPFTLQAQLVEAYTGFRGHNVSPPIDVGSVSPMLVRGAEIRHLFDFRGTTQVSLIINLLGNLPQNHFTQLSVNGQIFRSIDALFTPGGTSTQWTWVSRLANFVDGELYTVMIL